MDHSSPLPPLDTLRAFEAAARSGSFSAAAEALNLTHGAISRQVAKLEHWLGLRVFERQARGVALTPEGQRLFQRTQEAFSVFADSSDRWSEPRGTAVVRFSATPSVCSLWLMPRWQRLESGDPTVRIMLQVDHRKVDLEEEGIDLAIRCGRGGTPGRVSVQLFEEWCYPVASPELAKAIGEGRPERFLDQPLIHDSDAAGWRAWFNAQGLDFRPRQQDRRFEDYNLVLDAAASGLGVALSRPPLAQAQVDAGRVIRVDQRTALNPVSYWLDRPMGQPRPAAVALASRIAHEAGLSAGKLAGFLRLEAKAA
ncbi:MULTISPECIES: LysR substrate-binding domain-containing protein [unclassified Bosea (in: a-proteobacteria)]|uniref:LysR substrate-binding domain-containing protein n=1 Tax=unclassified Bosea (in: a-proteobacteria) TaxID=2653178 RepID=UPI000F75ADB4|nr:MULTISPECIES: LysR substrate-binding domain-containing protein [unclassified Bosea (in: a-proteobacteria)]AZO76285.1 transcriptional regulator [Bosea sp. Tri-49]RXT26213.1 transcriptional regulator [Bosea sp. Tri-39]RXT31455.1 transcriptional regulator [Bosea sp. Tri-54]